MATNDLLIKINADAKNAIKAFDDIRDKSEELEGKLKEVALISGAAFAALTAEVYLSVKSFESSQKSVLALNNALQNQGIYTKKLSEEYKSFAETVSAKTGIDDDAILKAQATAQAFLGQTQVTQELTNAIADLGTKMGGDLDGAAEKIARTIGTSTNAFARNGLVLSATATEAERMAKVLDFVRQQAGGAAEAMNKADGYSHALSTSFDDLQKAIGQRFAPIFVAIRQSFISFFDTLSSHPELVNLTVGIIAAGVAVTGIIAVLAAAIPAIAAVSAAAVTLGVSLSIAFVGIPVAIGVVVFALTELSLHWGNVMAFIKAATSQSITFVSELFGGLAKILAGVWDHFDTKKMAAGFDEIKNSGAKASEAFKETYAQVLETQKTAEEVQHADAKAAADKAEALKRQHQANLVAIEAANLELLQLQNEHASQDLIQLKSKEIETLKALDEQRTPAELARLRERLAQIQVLEADQQAEDLERQKAFLEIQAETTQEFKDAGIEINSSLREEQLAQARAAAKSEADIDRDLQTTVLKQKTDARNAELLDRKKYGQTVATLNKTLNSEEVTATKSAADSLVQLSNSKNSQLKDIGKAAAVTQIGIDTAKGAMAVYANFQTAIPYPPVSIPLGLAAAAALTIYGAERIGNVLSAQEGGLVEGGIPGRDSVPALLEPGELIVPKKNFNDVVGAVGGSVGTTNNDEMLATLRNIDNKFSQPQQTVIHGDVLTDEAYVNALVRKISDAIEFKNAQIFGVTA